MKNKFKYQVNYLNLTTKKCSVKYFKTLKGVIRFSKRHPFKIIVLDLETLEEVFL